MKPILYDKTGKTQLGVLEHCINCFTEEERNGGFTLTLTYPITDELHKDLIYDNIIVVKANDEYDNQQFRIAATERIIKGTVTVKAVHISYDLVYDLVQNVSFEKESCEYALNQLFRNSHFSKHYRGYSNIVNAQKYSANNKNIWEAIVGSTGSIIDTYGKGPEIIRDNTNIHVLNKRGTDRGVVIEYSVNMLDEALEIDASSIVTSIYGFARYTDEENNEHTVNAPRVNSSLIDNYAHPFIISKDYTDRFEQGTVPTEAQIQALAELDFRDGIDQPKCNYTVNFVPLSKCAGYENIQDQIHLCDIVTIKDKRYNIDTKANVIKYKYNVLLERYDTMELGDARNTLTQTIVGSTQKDLEQKIEDKTININDKSYPDTLPATSVLTLHAGLGTIQVDWTYGRQVYYSYQLYGSTQQGFIPTSADLLYEGQASSFLHTAAPGSTWYFRVRAKNTHGRFNEFSEEAGITCFIIDENTTYIEKGAIQDAYIGTLNLDRGWVGELKGHWIDARNLTVTDGNGVRTLDVDSFGRVKIDASEVKVNTKSLDIVIEDATKGLESRITQTADKLSWLVKSGTSSSNMELTSDALNVIADGINLNGYVTFTSLSQEGKTTINGGNITSGTIRGIEIISSINDNTNRVKMVGDGNYYYSPTTLAGKIAFDSNGEGTEESARDRFLIQSLNSYVLKLLSTGDMSITSYDTIFFEANNIQTNCSLTLGGTLNGTFASLANDITCKNIYCSEGVRSNTWYSGESVTLLNYSGDSIKLGDDLNGNWHSASGFSSIETSTLYCDEFYSKSTSASMFSTNGYDMYNYRNWDWQKHNILDPVIIGGTSTASTYGISAITESEEITTQNLNSRISSFENNNEEKSIIDEIKILEFPTSVTPLSNRSNEEDNISMLSDNKINNTQLILDVSNVKNKEDILVNEENVDLGKLVILLIKEIQELKNK